MRLRDPEVRVAPEARSKLGNGEVERCSPGSGTSSAFASIRGNVGPDSSCIRRAVSSCAGVTSTPTGRAPCLASQAAKYAVPQPELDHVSPATSPAREGRPRVRSKTPQVNGLVRPPPLGGTIRVLRIRPRPTVAVLRDVIGLRQDRRGRTAPARAARSPSSPIRARCSRRARARNRRESSPAPSRAGSWRPSSCARPRSRTRR